MRTSILMAIIFILIVAFIFAAIYFWRSVPRNICGDAICGVNEDCSTCVQDCACPAGQYCTNVGTCIKAVCGDEICSSEEESAQSCCEDCGCSEDKVCNKVTQQCQARPSIEDDETRNIALNYLKGLGISGNITRIIDTYYKAEIVKEVDIDCGEKDLPYPCQIILYINSKGEIIEEVKTI